mmetsp:Transcript_54717/g.168552  ORF Transcript_54717/g.168552 Transcript_54717/m.168552 type:complete len:263 (-) Transcript_54717:18-806(-)
MWSANVRCSRRHAVRSCWRSAASSAPALRSHAQKHSCASARIDRHAHWNGRSSAPGGSMMCTCFILRHACAHGPHTGIRGARSPSVSRYSVKTNRGCRSASPGSVAPVQQRRRWSTSSAESGPAGTPEEATVVGAVAGLSASSEADGNVVAAGHRSAHKLPSSISEGSTSRFAAAAAAAGASVVSERRGTTTFPPRPSKRARGSFAGSTPHAATTAWRRASNCAASSPSPLAAARSMATSVVRVRYVTRSVIDGISKRAYLQ